MALTPIDIQNKEFTKSGRKGYDATEVNNYLDQVITDFAAVVEENQQLKTRLADYEANDKQIEEMKQSVTQSILVAQEAADRLKRTADESAKKTLTQAQDEAHRLVDEALTKSNTMLADAEHKSNAMLADAEQKSNEMLTMAAAENEKLVYETDAIKRDTAEFKAKSVALLQAQIDLINSQDWQQVTAENGLVGSPVTEAYLKANQELSEDDTVMTKSIDMPVSDSVNSESAEEPQTYILMPEVNSGEKL